MEEYTEEQTKDHMEEKHTRDMEDDIQKKYIQEIYERETYKRETYVRGVLVINPFRRFNWLKLLVQLSEANPIQVHNSCIFFLESRVKIQIIKYNESCQNRPETSTSYKPGQQTSRAQQVIRSIAIQAKIRARNKIKLIRIAKGGKLE